MEEYTAIKTNDKNDIHNFYPNFTAVDASLNGNGDDGFYIRLKDGVYTYLHVIVTQNIWDSQYVYIMKALAQDNFDKSRWFQISYDTVNKTLEILEEMTITKGLSK